MFGKALRIGVASCMMVVFAAALMTESVLRRDPWMVGTSIAWVFMSVIALWLVIRKELLG